MGSYYCLIAGLPEIEFEENKLKIELLKFKEELRESLSQEDYKLIKLFYSKFDNENLLTVLNHDDPQSDPEINPLGELSLEAINETITKVLEEDNPTLEMPWFKEFILAKTDNKPLFEGLSWEDQLTLLWQKDLISTKNSFVKSWFKFNLDLTNLLTAINCREHGLDPEKYVIAVEDDEISSSLKDSSSKDFGISHLFDQFDEVAKISKEEHMLKRERKIDLLKWNYIEENSFFNYFTVEKVFAYLLKFDIVHRWAKLDKEVGQKMFESLVTKVRDTFEFEDDF